MSYSRSKKGPALVLATMLLLLLLPFGCIAGGAYTEAFPRPFSSAKWKVGQGDARCGMIADLQYRVGVVGRTREELVQLLGPAEDNYKDRSVSAWLLCPSFMDVWILEVRWEADRAKSAWVRDT